jgi:hypothetical protein
MTSAAPSAGTSSARSGSARLIKALMVLAVLLVGAAAVVLTVGLPSSGSSDAPFHGSPVPPLFGDAQLAVVDGPLKDAEARAHRAARRWLAAHPAATDEGFSNWAIAQIGPPPGDRATRAELARMHRIADHRTAAGTRAAVWLESHGKKQPWKVFRKQDKAFLPAQRYDAVKRALKDAFALGGTLQATAKKRYDRRSPYQADPTLHGLNQARFAGQARQSYPSKHTVDAAAGLAVLGPVAPHLRPEFDWFTDEIAYSRLYGAGHYPSDLTAGAYLGTLIGDYEARKAGLAS